MRALLVLVIVVTVAVVGLLVSATPVEDPGPIFTPATAAEPVEVDL